MIWANLLYYLLGCNWPVLGRELNSAVTMNNIKTLDKLYRIWYNQVMADITKRNPKGAGRPPALEKQLEEARSLARQLHTGASLGYGELAREYPDLMKTAIQLARGGYEVERFAADFTKYKVILEPSVPMMKVLLELLPKVLGNIELEENSPIANILRNLKANVANIQINLERPLGSDGERYNEGVVVQSVERPNVP